MITLKSQDFELQDAKEGSSSYLYMSFSKQFMMHIRTDIINHNAIFVISERTGNKVLFRFFTDNHDPSRYANEKTFRKNAGIWYEIDRTQQSQLGIDGLIRFMRSENDEL